MVRAFLGLGSNMGDRAGHLREAIRRLDGPGLRVTARSGVYETVPWGLTGQATFLNQVIGVDTGLAPRALLDRCRAVEASLGRVRSERWGPRTVDVDILVYGDAVVRERDLTIPHRDLAHRAFVLVPLAEAAPGLRLPDGTAVDALLAASPDRDTVWPWSEADAGAIGHEIRWFETLPSTNERARGAAEAGAAEGLVLVADRQTAGRGRLGREWASPPGGLWFSIVLRPRVPAAQAPLVGFAASISTAAAIQEITGLRARVKWPNDVLVDGRKVAGVLLEAGAARRATAGPAWLVAGIGINVNVHPDALPPRPRYPATSLAAVLGRDVVRGRLLRALLRAFTQDYAGLCGRGAAPLLDRWRALSDTLGRPVRIDTAAGPVEGLAEDVDQGGALVIRAPDGAVRRIAAGDVAGEITVEGVR